MKTIKLRITNTCYEGLLSVAQNNKMEIPDLLIELIGIGARTMREITASTLDCKVADDPYIKNDQLAKEAQSEIS